MKFKKVAFFTLMAFLPMFIFGQNQIIENAFLNDDYSTIKTHLDQQASQENLTAAYYTARYLFEQEARNNAIAILESSIDFDDPRLELTDEIFTAGLLLSDAYYEEGEFEKSINTTLELDSLFANILENDALTLAYINMQKARYYARNMEQYQASLYAHNVLEYIASNVHELNERDVIYLTTWALNGWRNGSDFFNEYPKPKAFSLDLSVYAKELKQKLESSPSFNTIEKAKLLIVLGNIFQDRGASCHVKNHPLPDQIPFYCECYGLAIECYEKAAKLSQSIIPNSWITGKA